MFFACHNNLNLWLGAYAEVSFGDLNIEAGSSGVDVYDYVFFDFVELCAESVYGTSFNLLSPSRRKTLLKNVKADISDHMPIWVRIPIPGT